MNLLLVVAIGSLTGLHAATWGSFKDSPFEGFRRISFVRSVLVAIAGAALLALTTGLESTQPPVVLIGLLYATERLSTEWWKSFVREDDQAAYAIPMRLAIGGRPIDARLPRYAVGLAVALGLVLAFWAAGQLQPIGLEPVWTLAVGGVGGWLTAIGGAWKDAPIEGFSGWKFLRSPAVATAWTLVLVPFTRDWTVLAVSAGGLSVASIETYKTFLTGGRPPGKFCGKPVRWWPHRVREGLRFLHSGLYVGFAVGLAGSLLANDRPAGEKLALLVMVVFAVLVALLVAVAAAPEASRFAMISLPDRSAARMTAATQEPDAHVDVRGKS